MFPKDAIMKPGDLLSQPNSKFSALVGDEGWLYIWGIDSLEEKVTGRLLATDGDLEAMGHNVGRRAAWCRKKRIAYRHLIGPDKSSVYPNHLPSSFPRGLVTLLDQCTSEWSREDRNIHFIDAAALLSKASFGEQVYFKTDSHWNYRGALNVFNEIARSLSSDGIDMPGFYDEDVLITQKRRVFELGALADEPEMESFEFIRPAVVRSKVVFESDSARGKIQVFENEDESLPRCVLFRDSYSSFFMPFLAERCSRLTVLKARHCWYDLIEQEKPDIVLTQIAERFLLPRADDRHGRTFESVFNVPMAPIVQAGRLSRAK